MSRWINTKEAGITERRETAPVIGEHRTEEILAPNQSEPMTESTLLYKTLSAPIDVQIELTEACDNQCLHCYNSWEREDPSLHHMSELQVVHIVDELGRNNVFNITFTGGEPTLNSPTLLAGLKEAGRYGMVTSLNTNLTHVSENFLSRLRDLGLERVLTSLVSFDETTHDRITQRPGSYRKTLAGIKAAQRTGLDVIVNMVVSKVNLDQVYQTGYFCSSELGINYFCATKASPSLFNKSWIKDNGLTPLELQQMLESLATLKKERGIKIDTLEPVPHCFFNNIERFYPLSKRKCVAALTTCTIGARGKIRPCSHADLDYGDVYTDGLSISWLRMAKWRSGELLPYTCRECEQLAECGGGCRVGAAHTHVGDYSAEDPFMGNFKNKNVSSSTPFFKRETPFELPNLPFRLAPSLRIRAENFGGIIDNCSQNLFVNFESFALISRLKGRVFFPNDLVTEEKIPASEVYGFFYPLWQGKFIQPERESDEKS